MNIHNPAGKYRNRYGHHKTPSQFFIFIARHEHEAKRNGEWQRSTTYNRSQIIFSKGIVSNLGILYPCFYYPRVWSAFFSSIPLPQLFDGYGESFRICIPQIHGYMELLQRDKFSFVTLIRLPKRELEVTNSDASYSSAL